MSTAQTQQRPVAATTTTTTTTAVAASGVDTADVATLNDALGSAGVDLRVLLSPFTLSTLSNDTCLGRRREFAAIIRLTPIIPPFRGSFEEATHNTIL